MADKSENVFGKGVVLPKGVMYYFDLDSPNTQEKRPNVRYASNKYDITVGIPKNIDLSEIKTECDEVAQKAFGTTDVDMPFANGDEKSQSNMAGKIIIRAKSSKRPNIVSSDKTVPITEAECDAGMWARVYVTPMSYLAGRNKGVTLLLKSVQVLENMDYDPIGGGDVSPEDIF